MPGSSDSPNGAIASATAATDNQTADAKRRSACVASSAANADDAVPLRRVPVMPDLSATR